ncbi:hypothetical protein Pfo_026559, partial [Paulownia fortunei]
EKMASCRCTQKMEAYYDLASEYFMKGLVMGLCPSFLDLVFWRRDDFMMGIGEASIKSIRET